VSCANCHLQALAFTDGQKFGIGTRGQRTDKNTMSIVNVLWSSPLMFWDGRAASLEEQAIQPIENPKEMDLPIQEAANRLMNIREYREKFKAAFNTETIEPQHIERALAQFQRTLISQDSKYDKFLRGEVKLAESELKGMRSFFTHPDPSINLRGSNCGDCHRNFLTDGFSLAFDGFANNGLDSQEEE